MQSKYFDDALQGNLESIKGYQNIHQVYEGHAAFHRYIENTAYYGKKAYGSLLMMMGGLLALTPATAGGVLIAAAGYGVFTVGDQSILPNTFDPKGWTLLHFAAAGNQQAVAKELIRRKIDYSAKDTNGYTFEDIAMSCGHTSFIADTKKFIVEIYKELKHKNMEIMKAIEQTDKLIEEKKKEIEQKQKELALWKALNETRSELNEANDENKKLSGSLNDAKNKQLTLAEELEGALSFISSSSHLFFAAPESKEPTSTTTVNSNEQTPAAPGAGS